MRTSRSFGEQKIECKRRRWNLEGKGSTDHQTILSAVYQGHNAMAFLFTPIDEQEMVEGAY